MNLVELRRVRADYDGIDALFGVDLAVAAGSICALLGPNGAGKSTALKVVAGLHRPTSGELYLGGRCVTGANPVDLARRGVCLVPEGRGVLPNLTVEEHLQMATFAGTSLADVTERAYDRFPRLAQRRKQAAGTMSGGEQQMFALARALATEPAVLLVDELSMGLAPIIVEQLYELVVGIAADGVAVLVVEQFASAVRDIADQAAIMVNGRIALSGGPDDGVFDRVSELYLGATA